MYNTQIKRKVEHSGQEQRKRQRISSNTFPSPNVSNVLKTLRSQVAENKLNDIRSWKNHLQTFQKEQLHLKQKKEYFRYGHFKVFQRNRRKKTPRSFKIQTSHDEKFG